MNAITEKHMVVVTALALGAIIFWLIASDPRTPTTASSLTSSPSLSSIASDPEMDIITTVTTEQSSD